MLPNNLRRMSAPQAAAIILLVVGLGQICYAFFFSKDEMEYILILLAVMNFVLALILWKIKRKPKA